MYPELYFSMEMADEMGQDVARPLEVTLIAGAGSAKAGEGDLRSMLTAALDGIVELCRAEQGMILLFKMDGEVLVELARDSRRRRLDPRVLGVTDAVLESVRRRGGTFWRKGFPRLEVGSDRFSRHLVAVSMPTHDREAPCGLVYLSRRDEEFGEGARHLVEGVAQLVAVATSRDAANRWRWRSVDVSPSIWRREKAA